jgi:hypothetical protein
MSIQIYSHLGPGNTHLAHPADFEEFLDPIQGGFEMRPKVADRELSVATGRKFQRERRRMYQRFFDSVSFLFSTFGILL